LSSCCVSRSATPALSSTIVGTSKVDHLRANLAIAAKGPLPSGLYEKPSDA